ncbi:MAG: alkaline phosphatase family protein, partial [Euryarchaeota archaeon]|nr:alkaline phosphatase family protein [Euryarchaeota archaeon]
MKKVLIISILLLLLSGAALAVSQITLNEVKRPQSAILFIVDGFGSSYYYPELTPIALDGSELLKARTRNLTFGTRIVDIKTSHPITGIAHSVIATGYSEANEEVVGYTDATIFDVTRKHGFVNIAVMQKGDFKNMREEQDIIIFDENNSINKPSMSIQSKSPPIGVYDSMYEWKMKVPSYMNKSGVDRYSAYNKWGIDTANAVMKFMIKNHPDQKFLLTVNIGAIDSGGHNLGADDYIRLIEDLDRDFYALYKTASENNIALFFTADHGMSFAKKNAQRGGHSGDKYISRQESLRIP